MAIRYVYSGGSNTAPYDTWAKAKTGLSAAAVNHGDVVYVASDHSESLSAAWQLLASGSNTNPTQHFSVDRTSGEPPTTYAAGASIATTASNALTVAGGAVAHYTTELTGFTFTAGDGTGSAPMGISTNSYNFLRLRDCTLRLGGTGGGYIQVGGGSYPSFSRWENTTVKFAATSQYIVLNYASLDWVDGGLESGTTSPTVLLKVNSVGTVNFNCENLDLSAGGSGMHLTQCSVTLKPVGKFRNCKLPSGWTGDLVNVSGSIVAPTRVEMHNCDSSSTNYRVWIVDAAGSVKQNISVYLDGGKTDGTTSLSYEFATTAQGHHAFPLIGPDFVAWNDTTGSNRTATVEIVHDGSSALTNDEIWLEVSYLGDGSFPLGTTIRDDVAADNSGNYQATAAAQATSSATWTGDTGTGPNGSSTWHQLKLSCPFTPQKKGPVYARVILAKASTTVYVDPNVIVT